MMDKIQKTGERIRIHRLIKNYSQEYMAWSLGISQAAYSYLESEQTELTVKRVYEIAEILEISPFELLPKPKYGFVINHEYVLRTMKKIKALWIDSIKKRQLRFKGRREEQ